MKKIIIGKIFLIFILINTYSLLAFNIIEIFPNLAQDSNRAEFLVYKLLKKRPINKNIDYVFAPWWILARNSKSDKHPNLNDLSYLKVKNGVTVCSIDAYERLIPFFKSIGIKTLFVSAGNNKKFDDIDIITIPYPSKNSGFCSKKNIFYSFLGCTTNKCRKVIFNMQHPSNTIVINRDELKYSESFNNIKKEKMQKEYIDIIKRSRFSLCPRGYAPGTYRFWESLQAGAIPVLISDNYQFPPGFDWDSCIIKIKEEDVTKIPEILSKISQHKENEMRKNCLQAYKLYSGNNFDRVIREYFK